MKAQWLVLASVVFVFMFIGIAIVDVHAVCCNPDACVCGQYVDADGDGICDLCDGCIPQGDDADGDGIPNGQDDDYVPPQDGTGKQIGKNR
jgi:hypothetical protein